MRIRELQALVEVVEKKKRKVRHINYYLEMNHQKIRNEAEDRGYNYALKDLIQALTDTIKELKEEK